MPEKNTTQINSQDALPRHSLVGRSLHWITGGLVLYGYAKGLRNVSQLNDPELLRFEVMFALGLGVALLLRFVWMKKLNNGASRISECSSKFQKAMVRLGHNAIYLMLGGIILTGLAIAAIFVSPISGGLLENAMISLHNGFVFLAGGLMIGHVVIALYHKYWLKDGIMETMLRLRIPFTGKKAN
ncbi:MAG: cytochrome b [Nitratireductor sp.]